MKKTVALMLTLALTLPLFACGGTSLLTEDAAPAETVIRRTGERENAAPDGEHNAEGFCAGVGRADITPTFSVPLGGYGNSAYRFSTEVLDPLYATCLALRDEAGGTLLLFHLDVICVWPAFGKTVRPMIARATGVPEENILLNATHTHSGPDGGMSEGIVDQWKGQAYRELVAAAKDAIADLDHCEKVLVGTVETDRLNFVRRYFKENGFCTDNADYGTGEITGHETEADQEMRIVRFEREKQPPVVVANWQCHPHRTVGGAKTSISSDIIGVMRKKAEKELGVKFLFLQGGAGNINPTTRIPAEQRYTDYKDIGNALYEHLADGLNGMTEVRTGKVGARAEDFTAPYNAENVDDAALLEAAGEIVRLRDANQWEQARARCAAVGLSSPYEAGSLVSRAARLANATEAPVSVACYAFGDVAIAACPFESFHENETELRERSPFAFTLTLGYSNTHQGYMPSSASWDHRGYEVVTSIFARGVGEMAKEHELALLNELYAAY